MWVIFKKYLTFALRKVVREDFKKREEGDAGDVVWGLESMLLLRLLQFLYHLLLGRYISTTGQCFRILLIPHPSQELGGKSMITRSSAAAVCGYHQEERERDMYSYLCNRALAATCHATATSNKTNKVKFVWVGLCCKPISLSPSTKRNSEEGGFLFLSICCCFFFAFFDVFWGGSRKTDSNL